MVKVVWDKELPPSKCARCGKILIKIYYSEDREGNVIQVCKDCLDKETKVSKVSKVSKVLNNEVNEDIPTKPFKPSKPSKPLLNEKYWYPQFKLCRDPFAFYDFRSEQEYGLNLEYIDTQGTRLVWRLIQGRSSVFIVGPKGCGKSVALSLGIFDPSTGEGISNHIQVLGTRSLVELLNELWGLFNPLDSELMARTFKQGSLIQRLLTSHGSFCEFKECKRRTRCSFLTDKPLGSFLMWQILDDVKFRCPFKEFVFDRYIEEKEIKTYIRNCAFLIDAPDDLAEIGPFEFKNVIQKLIPCGVVIIATTPEQYQLCQKADFFARFPKYDFPIPDKKTLRQIIRRRVEYFYETIGWNGKKENPLPFSDEALDHLIELSGFNIRNLIFLCQKVLDKMRRQSISKPISIKFLDTVHEIKLTKSKVVVGDALNQILKKYNRQWVKVKLLSYELKQHFNIDYSEKRLGRLVKKMSFDHRSNPDSEYFIIN